MWCNFQLPMCVWCDLIKIQTSVEMGWEEGGRYSRQGGSECADFVRLGRVSSSLAQVGPRTSPGGHTRCGVPTEVLVLSNSLPCLLMHKLLINYKRIPSFLIQIGRRDTLTESNFFSAKFKSTVTNLTLCGPNHSKITIFNQTLNNSLS